MSTALLPSALRPARTNASQAAEYSSDPGSSATAEDACCRYLASRALPDLRLGVLAAALSVLGAALRFFSLRSVITMPTHDAWCGMHGSGPCVWESGLCVRESCMAMVTCAQGEEACGGWKALQLTRPAGAPSFGGAVTSSGCFQRTVR